MTATNHPLYRRIAADLALRLNSGECPPGTRLPAVRQLARQYGVNNLTALQAYRWLEEQQQVVARARNGFFAAGPGRLTTSDTADTLPSPGTWVHVDDRVANLLTLSASAIDVQLHMADADQSLYPAHELARRLQHKLQRDPALIGAYLPAQEEKQLKGELVKLATSYQLALDSEQILMTNGCTEAIQLALRCLTKPGDVVAVETPVYFGLLQTLESLGLKALEIPCTPQHGISLEALEFALSHGPAISCLVVVPNFQNPTGALMPDEHKKRLLELARRFHFPIIEDDVFGELHYSGERPLPIKAWDRDGMVIYCCSFTKSFAPAFRLGWTSGGIFHKKLERLKVSNSYVTSALIQACMADCLSSGLYARQVQRLRQHLNQQSQQLRLGVLAAFPRGTTVTQPQGGMLLWLQCPDGVDSLQLLQQALPHSISFAPGPVFSAEPRFSRCLRLNVGHPWEGKLPQAIQQLGALAHGQLGAKSPA
jgi:DNA-binding transcriptional MocR family regulator